MVKKTFFVVLLGLSLAICPQVFAEDLSATISVDPVAFKSNDKLLVTISGTYSCGPIPQPQGPGSTFANFSGSLSQASGRNITQGGFGMQPLCDGQIQEFETGVHPDYIPWHGGKARVIAFIFVQKCDQFYDCENVNISIDEQVSIRGGGNN